MVQIYKGARLNIPCVELNKKPSIKDDAPAVRTEGNNNEAQPNRVITGGKGTRKKPFVLDLRTWSADMDYLRDLAEELGYNIYFITKEGKTGIVTPGGEIAPDKN